MTSPLHAGIVPALILFGNFGRHNFTITGPGLLPENGEIRREAPKIKRQCHKYISLPSQIHKAAVKMCEAERGNM